MSLDLVITLATCVPAWLFLMVWSHFDQKKKAKYVATLDEHDQAVIARYEHVGLLFKDKKYDVR